MKTEVKWLAPGHMGSRLLRVDFLIKTLIHLGQKGFYNIDLNKYIYKIYTLLLSFVYFWSLKVTFDFCRNLGIKY